jgi:hypothetical protein
MKISKIHSPQYNRLSIPAIFSLIILGMSSIQISFAFDMKAAIKSQLLESSDIKSGPRSMSAISDANDISIDPNSHKYL